MPRDDFEKRQQDDFLDGAVAGFLVLNRMRNIANTVRDALKEGSYRLEIDGIEADIRDWMGLCVDISNEMFIDHSDNPGLTRPTFLRWLNGSADTQDLIYIKNVLLQLNADLMDEADLHPSSIRGRDVGEFLHKMLSDPDHGEEVLEDMTKALGIPKEQILQDIQEMRDAVKAADDDPHFSGPEGMDETVAEIDPQQARMSSSGSAALKSLLGRPLPEPFLPFAETRISFDYNGFPIKDIQKIIDEIDMTLSAS